MNILRTALYFLLALALSFSLMVSIPVITLLLGENSTKKKQKEIRTTEVKIVEMTAVPPPQSKQIQKPRQLTLPRQSGKAGPRFAMSLGAQGLGGVEVPGAITSKGVGMVGNKSDGVDQRPQLQSSLDLQIPEALRKAETNGTMRLSFCVDASGSVFGIKVSEENPKGIGLAQAGIDALKKVRFTPATKGGQPVPFCGMEQPVEIKFRN